MVNPDWRKRPLVPYCTIPQGVWRILRTIFLSKTSGFRQVQTSNYLVIKILF